MIGRKNIRSIILSFLIVILTIGPALAIKQSTLTKRFIQLSALNGSGLNLFVNKNDINHDLSEGDFDLRIFFDCRSLMKEKQYPQNIKVEIYTFEGGQRKLFSILNRTIKNKKAARNVLLITKIPRIEKDMDLMFDIFDTQGTLTATYSQPIAVTNSQVVALESAPIFDCNADDGECLIEYILRHVSFSANFDRHLKTEIHKNDKGRYFVNIPVKRARRLKKRVRKFNVDDLDGSGGSVTANPSFEYPFFNNTSNTLVQTGRLYYDETEEAIKFNFTEQGDLFSFGDDGDFKLGNQLNFTSDTLNTVPQEGAFEYDGSGLYFTIGGTRVNLFSAALSGGDNLGNHIADMDLNMNGHSILGADQVNGNIANFNNINTGDITITNGASAGFVLTSDAAGNASWQSITGDNLGNHIAEMDLNMNGFNLVNANILYANGAVLSDSFALLNGATAGFVLTSDANGNASWQAAPGGANGDNLGNHIATQALDMNGFSLVNADQVNGNTANFVNGNITNLVSETGLFNGSFTFANGASNGFVLVSDANGLSSWVDPTTLSGIGADNLGNHLATQGLEMAGFTINNADQVNGNTANFINGNITNLISESGLFNGSFTYRNGATAGFVLTTDANGLASWQAAPGGANGDNLGNHLATQGLEMAGFTINNADQVNGVTANFTNGNITNISSESAVINGSFSFTNGATAGFVLTSDANGNATWQAAPGGANGDNLGNHNADMDLNMNGFDLVNANILYANGAVLSDSFTFSNGASTGFVLTSDANGVATWQDPTTLASNGDDLGNHTAIQVLDMAGFTINNADQVNGNTANFTDANILGGRAFFNGGSLAQFNGQILIPNGATNGFVLASDANGFATWTSAAALSGNGDNLGNHTATQALDMAGFSVTSADQINGNTANFTDFNLRNGTAFFNGGSFAQFNGTFSIPTGAINGYILTSDANGVGTWQNLATLVNNNPNINTGEFTENPTFGFLYPSDNNGAQNVIIGDNNIVNADIILGKNGNATFNEQGNDVDFSIEGSANTDLLFIDGGQNRIGLGTLSPEALVEVGNGSPAQLVDPQNGMMIGGELEVTYTVYADTADLENIDLANFAYFRPGSIAQFNGSLVIPTGAANGLVLTSDANGLASWQAATGGSGDPNGNVFVVNSDVISNNGTDADYQDDFVIGSPSLDYSGNSNHSSRLFFNKSSAAFRAGVNSTNTWDTASVGNYSVAFGNGTTSSGIGTFTYGQNLDAGTSSIAATNTGDSAGGFASGGSSIIASGGGSTAKGTGMLGSSIRAQGPGSYAGGFVGFGGTVIANGGASFAYGNAAGNVRAEGTNAWAIGDDTVANGNQSFAFGTNNIAENISTFAFGNVAEAYGDYSIAIGELVRTNGANSIALGNFTQGDTANTVVIGVGHSTLDRLHNSISNSLVVGFDSNAATFFIGPSAGGSTTGNIGIATTSPAAKLDIIGDIKITDGTESNGFVLTSDANGLASWTDPTTIPGLGGDNLGNHLATQGLEMAGFTINNADQVNGNTANFTNINILNGRAFFNGSSLAQFNGQILIPNGATNGFVLASDANGYATWTSAASLSGNGDNLGNHTATQALDMAGFSIINIDQANGNTANFNSVNAEEGVFNGSLIYRNGATAGFVLVTDANGAASWASASSLGVNGDNLGNHTATQALDMTGFSIINIDQANGNTANFSTINSTNLSLTSGYAFFNGATTAQFNGSLIYDPSSSNNGMVLMSLGNGIASWLPAPSGADNMGSHLATQVLNMAGFSVTNADQVNGNTANFTTGEIVTVNSTSFNGNNLTMTNGFSFFNGGTIAQFNGTINIPTGATLGYVLTSDASGDATWQDLTTLASNGDDLGNHTATQALDMSGFTIDGADQVNGNTANFTTGEIVTVNSTSFNGNNLTMTNGFSFFNGATTAQFNGSLIYDPSSSNNGMVLMSLGNGLASWLPAPSGADNMGSHLATQVLNMAGFSVTNADQINGNTANFTDVNATSFNGNNLTMTNGFSFFNGATTAQFNGTINIPTGATLGYVLTSDANGLASWQPAAPGGASSNGALGAIQLSDGSGGFTSDENNFYVDTANGFTVLGDGTNFVTAIGEDAASNMITANSQYTNAIGYQAAMFNNGNFSNTIGYLAARSNRGSFVNAIGGETARDNTGSYVNTLGYRATSDNTGSFVNAIGYLAARNNTASAVNSSGYYNARFNSGSYLNSIGYFTAYTNTGDNVNAIGQYSAYNNSGDNVTAIGQYAGYNNNGDYNIAIGYYAGFNTMNGSANIILGRNTDVADPNLNKQINIGNTLYGGNGSLVLGRVAGSSTATLEVNGSFLYTDGTEANGFVLTSDANGLASWMPASGGGSSVGAAGTMQFSDGAGGFNGDETDFYFDDVNNRLVINTANVNAAALNVNGYALIGDSTNDVIAIGNRAANNLGGSGTFINAIGYQAAQSANGTQINAMGYQASRNATSSYLNAMGYQAGMYSRMNYVNAFGFSSGRSNNGQYLNALNLQAGQYNNGDNVNAFGANAARYNNGDELNAIGPGAAQNNLGNSVNAIGNSTALDNVGSNVDAIGWQAMRTNNGNYAIGIGYRAGYTNKGDGTIAIGRDALIGSNGDYNIAIGYLAGEDIEDGARNILIGYDVEAPDGNENDQLNIGDTIYGSLDNGEVAIGRATNNPNATLEVNGSFMYTDGTEANGFVLTSDANGLASWQPAASGGDLNGNVFVVNNDVISNNGSDADYQDDFVIGSPSLADTGDANHDRRMFFDKSNGAFRAGRVLGTQWDSAQLGNESTAFGSSNIANGNFSFAAGTSNIVSGTGAAGFGSGTQARGSDSFTAGNFTVATGTDAVAFGRDSIASGLTSTVFGNSSEATGNISTAFGEDTIASGDYTTTFGQYVEANGDNSITFGLGNSTSDYLINTVNQSLMIGFNSNAATLFVGPAAGGSTTGNIGIATTSPQAKLDIIGDIKITDGTQSNGFVLTSDANGLASWQPAPSGSGDTNGEVFVVNSNVISNNGSDADYQDDFVVGSSSLDDTGVSSHDNRMFFDKSSGSFRAGSTTATDWDSGNRGNYSAAFGLDTLASGDGSFSYGTATGASVISATGDGAFAGGSALTLIAGGIQATGDGSFAVGTVFSGAPVPSFINATNSGAFAGGIAGVGSGVESTGAASFAFGHGSGGTISATGNGAFALGTAVLGGLNSNGTGSFAIGSKARASADYAFTIGTGAAGGAGNDLVNTQGNSLVVGFNSNDATLYVGPSTGADTTGNVGVGTNTPSHKLSVQVADSTSEEIVMSIGSASMINSENITLLFDEVGSTRDAAITMERSATSQKDLIFETSASASLVEVMRVTGNERVGIGIDVPETQLHISGTGTGGDATISHTGGSAELFMRRADSSIAATNLLGSVYFTGDDGATNAIGASVKGIADGTWSAGNYNTSLVFSTSSSNGADLERMRLDSNGNLAIGVTSAAARVDVNGTTMSDTYVNTGLVTKTPGGAVTIDWNEGNYQSITLNAATTFTFTNPTSGIGRFVLLVYQDATGSRTATWPAGVLWPGGSTPVLSTVPNSYDIVTCIYNGTNYACQVSLDFR